jgi:hypothetical protein
MAVMSAFLSSKSFTTSRLDPFMAAIISTDNPR